ncbi:MAG: dTDP-glucose 4,6-dehydratase [bacterium]|nr:MAG: dTDP-glucose 4,6-dehydratase [bacterium]
MTGAAGFIGSNFVQHLAGGHDDISITVLDKLTYAGNPANLAPLSGRKGYRFVKGDIADPAAVDGLVAEADYIVNFAAESFVDRSIEDARPFLKSNIEGPLVLLEAARRHGVTRFLQVSTDEVYGEVFGPSGGDALVFSFGATYDMPVVITRCSNNYGPYQYPEKLIPLFVTNAMEDKPLPVYGNGRNTRDWIHVSDHCRAIEAVLRHPGAEGEIYNVAAENELNVLEITAMILEALGKPTAPVDHVADRPGHDRRYALDAAKLRAATGWEPKVAFPEGLHATVQWYLANEAWWRPIKSGAWREYYAGTQG